LKELPEKNWPAINYIEKIMAALFLAALFIQVEENAGSACSRSRLIDQDAVSYSFIKFLKNLRIGACHSAQTQSIQLTPPDNSEPIF
jgi:hypothetical protein